MNVVILCGGKGTRIRGVDDRVPKPMITVGDLPIVVHIMQRYAKFGHRRFILCLGYLGNVISEYFGSTFPSKSSEIRFLLPDGISIDIVLANTREESMTGSRVAQIQDHVNGDFMLTYGDGVSDVAIDQLVQFHQTHDCAMTLTAVRPPSRFGEVQVDNRGMATSFNEKPQASSGLISGGFFVCRSSVFEYLRKDASLVLEAEPMREMVKRRSLAAFVHPGFWQCMDTYRDWELLNDLERSGKAPWRL